MKMSENINELAEAFAKAQSEFPPLKPDSKKEKPKRGKKVEGEVDDEYWYAGLPKILAVVRPILNNHGISLSQDVSTHAGEVKTVTYLLHKSGQWMSGDDYILPVLRGSKNLIQAIGEATTYGRRYDGSAFLGIAAEKDEDGANLKEPVGNARASSRGKDKGTGTKKGATSEKPPANKTTEEERKAAIEQRKANRKKAVDKVVAYAVDPIFTDGNREFFKKAISECKSIAALKRLEKEVSDILTLRKELDEKVNQDIFKDYHREILIPQMNENQVTLKGLQAVGEEIGNLIKIECKQ